MTYRQIYYQKNKEKWETLYRENRKRKLGECGIREYYRIRRATYRLKYPEKIKAYQEKCSREKTWRKYYYGNLEVQRERRKIYCERKRRERGAMFRSEMVGPNHPRWTGSGICPTCNGVKSNRVARECRRCSARTYSGPNSWAWRGGHTGFRKVLYATWKYKQWRQNVFKRDGFTCQMCFHHGGYLEAHHKKRMIVIIKEFIPNPGALKGYQVRDRLLNYEPLWNLDNGITLCQKCHREESRHDKAIVKQQLMKSCQVS